MPTILDDIVARTRRTVAESRAAVPEAELERRLADAPPARDFEGALRRARGVGVIAEVKKASPSAGVIRADFDPVSLARAYADAGADCISVLTDEPFFQGSLDYLRAIRRAVPTPLLRKDFVIDRYQLLEARDAGADAVLLIAECLPGDTLAELYAQARELGLHVLVELHDAEELPRVLASGATLVGVNNRDLRTFDVRLEHTVELRRHVPADRLVVGESGIRTPADVATLVAGGAGAILVGESLMRQADVGAALRALLADTRPALGVGR